MSETKSGICWKQAREKVMHIIQPSHVLKGEIVQVFFFIPTYALIA